MNDIITPLEYMVELDWDIDSLERAIKFLDDWDTRSDEFYRNHKKIHKDFDKNEREHYRNCVEFWKIRLKYETQ